MGDDVVAAPHRHPPLPIEHHRQLGQQQKPHPDPQPLGRAAVARARFMGRERLVAFRLDDGGPILKATVPGVFMPAAGTVMWLMIRRDRCFVFPSRD